jgi:hypothetical protein
METDNYLQISWWNKRLNPWMFWIDPYSHVRVSDIHGRQAYYYDRPKSDHEKILKEKGWEYIQGNPDAYRTENQQLAMETLEILGLSLPLWEANHCYRVYWREPMYYI